MKWLKSACGTRFQVDDDVWVWAKDFDWYLKQGYPCRYVTSTRHGQKDNYEAYLHREVLHFPIGFVHHVDENPLNAQRQNLQVMSPRAHVVLHGAVERSRLKQRKAGPRSSSGYKGVSWHKRQRKWTAQISIGGKSRTLGYYDSAEQAAMRYDAEVILFLPPGTYTNLVPHEKRE